MSRTKKNFIYNSLFQIFSIIVPIILAPYLSRKLGTKGSGVYSYTYSIVYYFMLFVMLGINNYGNRCVAKVRDNKKKLSTTFSEIYSIQLLLGFLVLIIYIILLLTVFKKYSNIFIVMITFIISSIIDINWFFYGLEEFKITVIRSFILKAINLLLIFIFVKKQEDVWIYSLIMGGTTLTNQLVLLPFLKNRIDCFYFSFSGIKKHIKPVLLLFIPVVAVSLYKIMDKIMLGSISTVSEVGIYEYAEKINSIPLTIIVALGTVMLPKISYISHNKKNVVEYLNKSLSFVLFFSIPLFWFFKVIMPDLIPLYLGESFRPSIYIVELLALTLPFVSFANVIRTQYLIPMEKDNIYIYSIVIGAVLNLIFNFIFIPKYQSVGACLGTIIAEISVMMVQVIFISRDLNLTKYIFKTLILILKSISIYIIIIPIYKSDLNVFFKMIVETIMGILLYSILNINYIKTIIKRRNTNDY